MATPPNDAIGTVLERVTRRPILRVAGAVVGLLLCVAGARGALTIGFSRWLIAKSGSLGSLNRAVNLSPQDASAYQSRAAELLKRGDFSLVANDLRQAISLRAGDYHLWSELAAALSRDGKLNEALAAAAEAESLAPDYTSTHWDRGTLLLKVGRRDEAFDEFREVSLNRPDLFISALNIAWDEYG